MKPPVRRLALATPSNPIHAQPTGQAWPGCSIIQPVKFSFAVGTLGCTLFLFVIAATGAEKSTTLPAYPNQPKINEALNQLSKAQEKLDGNQADALAHLKKAALALEESANNKGSFRRTSIRLTHQAIKHLGQKDTATAKRGRSNDPGQRMRRGIAGGGGEGGSHALGVQRERLGPADSERAIQRAKFASQRLVFLVNPDENGGAL